MAIGIVSSEDFLNELDRLTGQAKENTSAPVEAEIVDKPHKGRSEGDTNVPEVLQEIIGETAVIEGRKPALAVAESWGISPSSVSAYSKGATSTKTYDQPKKSLIDHLNKSKMKAVKRAGKTMGYALENITPTKLEATKAKDLASIAKDMSAIIRNLEPQQQITNEDKSPQFVIFAPQFRDERSFQTIVSDE